MYGLSLTLTSFLRSQIIFHGYFLVRKNILLWRVILFLSFSRVKKVKSLMFLELIFHAHQTRLNEGFILSAYRLVCKYPKPTTVGGVALMKLVLLFWRNIRNASTVAPTKVESKIRYIWNVIKRFPQGFSLFKQGRFICLFRAWILHTTGVLVVSSQLFRFYSFFFSFCICLFIIYCPRRDFAQKLKFRGGTLVTRAYIKESTCS